MRRIPPDRASIGELKARPGEVVVLQHVSRGQRRCRGNASSLQARRGILGSALPLREREIDDLQNRASRSTTSIHSIQFGEGPNQSNGNWIQVLAEGTSGKYRYINVNQLSDENADR